MHKKFGRDGKRYIPVLTEHWGLIQSASSSSCGPQKSEPIVSYRFEPAPDGAIFNARAQSDFCIVGENMIDSRFVRYVLVIEGHKDHCDVFDTVVREICEEMDRYPGLRGVWDCWIPVPAGPCGTFGRLLARVPDPRNQSDSFRSPPFPGLDHRVFTMADLAPAPLDVSQVFLLAPNIVQLMTFPTNKTRYKSLTLDPQAVDPTHPCHRLVTVIRQQLEEHTGFGTRIANVNKITLTHNEELSGRFKSQYQLMQVRSASLRPEWPESNAKMALRQHLGETIDPGREHMRLGWRQALQRRLFDFHLSRMRGIVRALAGASVAVDDPVWRSLARAGLDLVWHGVSHGNSDNAIKEICAVGMRALGQLNSGWWGRGVYFTHHPVLADWYHIRPTHIPYISTGHKLVLAWVLLGQAYPTPFRLDSDSELLPPDVLPYVLRADKRERDFQGGYPSADSHYAAVGHGGSHIDWTQNPDLGNSYDEICVLQESNILPLAIVEYDLN
eukprot:comp22540_c0_seq2/m.57087 comp22540_c0_seq2/g.57087  ORF comp22540_c0_seq2/g.57087 comp22540_c0_seq2/m.57087 type:complete len:499 (-) comp22540_c0_seq2:171-1667(-)